MMRGNFSEKSLMISHGAANHIAWPRIVLTAERNEGNWSRHRFIPVHQCRRDSEAKKRRDQDPRATEFPDATSHTCRRFIHQQTAVINAIRDHLAEYSIVTAVGRNGVEQLLGGRRRPSDKRLPEVARGSRRSRRPIADAQGGGIRRMVNALLRIQRTSKRVRYGLQISYAITLGSASWKL
jgi:hypothetical protein